MASRSSSYFASPCSAPTHAVASALECAARRHSPMAWRLRTHHAHQPQFRSQLRCLSRSLHHQCQRQGSRPYQQVRQCRRVRLRALRRQYKARGSEAVSAHTHMNYERCARPAPPAPAPPRGPRTEYWIGEAHVEAHSVTRRAALVCSRWPRCVVCAECAPLGTQAVGLGISR